MILAAAKKSQSLEDADTGNSSLPFHLTLSTATLPFSLTSYLAQHHKGMQILASPNLHKLPPKLKTEHVQPPSGGLNASVEKKLNEIWTSNPSGQVVVFCNRNTKVDELSNWLRGRGVENLAFGTNRVKGLEVVWVE